MKRFTIMIMLFFAISSVTFAQPGGDEHPTATISILDQSGNLVPINNGQAIAFKDAFIDLVLNTGMGKDLVDSRAGGDKRMVITQADPQQNGNAYQLTYTRFINNGEQPLFSFLYNVDDNLLYHYQDYDKTWAPVSVEGQAINLLNECQRFGRFNEQGGTVASNDNYSAPVDADVVATTPPPPLPDYDQPECPADGYLWQPGYWAFRASGEGYYWVPGAWVAPPRPGLLWTPPYWGNIGGRFAFHAGYWGVSVGFYGGINYGHGYQGEGFVGGEWRDNHFRYNTAVVRVNRVNVHNTYVNTTVINNVRVNNHVSYNGTGGINKAPSQNEQQANRQEHIQPTKQQIASQVRARQNPQQFSRNNGGRPANVVRQRTPVAPYNNRKQH
jgi:hypothetical protein